MATTQPRWRMVANLGDVNPIEYGGFFVYVDQTGAYRPEAELLLEPDEDNGISGWTVYRFTLEDCSYTNGVLSDNWAHQEMPAWFADSLESIASFISSDVDTLRQGFLSDDPIARAWSWRAVGDYHGFDNLDSYPLTFAKKSDLPRRFTRAKVVRS